MNNTSRIVTALAIGAAAGAIVGLLFAPNKGVDTRKKIKKQGQKFVDKLQDQYRQAEDKINELKEGIQESASGLQSKLREAKEKVTSIV